jgi:hypothetical protein
MHSCPAKRRLSALNAMLSAIVHARGSDLRKWLTAQHISYVGGKLAALWDPFWGPYGPFGYLPNLAYGNDKGEVKLAADPKQAGVYIDGAYAGTADCLKTLWLEPGAYDRTTYRFLLLGARVSISEFTF